MSDKLSQDETRFLTHQVAARHGIAAEAIERGCMDFLRTGSEEGFQYLRLMLDSIMDARQSGMHEISTDVLRSIAPELVDAVAETAERLAAVTERDPAITNWASEYMRSHAWRVASDVAIAQRVIGALPGGRTSAPRGLDVGSAPYLFTAHMKREGFELHGIDIDPARQGNLLEREGLTIFAHDLESDDPGQGLVGQYDVVILNEVFEHLRMNPLQVLRKLRSWLRPGGRLILSTPNAQSLDAFTLYLNLGVMFGVGAAPFSEYSKLETLGHMGHVREYTAPEVIDTLSRLGFRCRELLYRFYPDMYERISIKAAHARWGRDFVLICEAVD
ncbi:MAG: methyltransferase domain-containing protein [Gammaproteobacteria bacterium]